MADKKVETRTFYRVLRAFNVQRGESPNFHYIYVTRENQGAIPDLLSADEITHHIERGNLESYELDVDAVGLAPRHDVESLAADRPQSVAPAPARTTTQNTEARGSGSDVK